MGARISQHWTGPVLQELEIPEGWVLGGPWRHSVNKTADSIEYSHTIRRCSPTTYRRLERKASGKTFGVSEVVDGASNAGETTSTNCSKESSKDSKDSGEFHDD